MMLPVRPATESHCPFVLLSLSPDSNYGWEHPIVQGQVGGLRQGGPSSIDTRDGSSQN